VDQANQIGTTLSGTYQITVTSTLEQLSYSGSVVLLASDRRPLWNLHDGCS
jgi:hypothetical protein